MAYIHSSVERLMGLFDHYRAVTHIKPYSHQVDTYKALKAGQSVILRAPTGSGKSEGVFVPSLPMLGIGEFS
ncbi:MAG TPA: hypothetical protein EYP21_07140 [Syntrophaceae bacterium]|nr:hypothetical protein [Syntrophaceae bacterium]